MFIALGALVIIGVLVAASSYITLQETRFGQNQLVESRAFSAAEYGLNKIQSDWNKSPNLGMDNGTSYDTSYVLNVRDTVRVRYTRLNNETFWIVSEGRSFVGTQQYTNRVAVKRVGAILRLRIPSIKAKGAITVDGRINIKSAANVHGENAKPSNWTGCDDSKPGLAAIVAPVASPEPVTIAKTSNVTSPAGSGMAAVTHDPEAGNAATYVSFGDENWNTLKLQANVTIPAGGASPDPAPSEAAGACTKSDPNNWGEPWRAPLLIKASCVNYFPIIYVAGDLEIHGGRGQGILLVEGNVKINGGFQFYGLVIAKGDVLQGTGGAHLHGALMTGNNATVGSGTLGDAEELIGNIRIDYSQCSLEHAMRGSAQVVQAKERAWAELY
jgi:hypothetical protein